jgi:hypothetical protein
MPSGKTIALVAITATTGICLIVFVPRMHRSKQAAQTPSSRLPAKSKNPMFSAPASSSASPSAALSPKITASDQQKRFIEAFATPIDFYGRVIDQHGDVVSGADVKIAVNDKPFGGRPSEYSKKTDEIGSFAINGIRGLTLAVEVSKPGYDVIPPADNGVTSSGLFEYGLSSNRGKPHSSMDKPIVFTLRKPGMREPLVKIDEQNLRIERDGTPLLISIDREQLHNVVIRCWTNDNNRADGQRKYDWRLETSVERGSLAPRTDTFNYEAPDAGYGKTDVINMPASLLQNQWHGFAKRSYFIRFDDGIFARAEIEIHAGGDHFVVWSSALNPKPGSRNLE